jgi:predicted metal-binding protein
MRSLVICSTCRFPSGEKLDAEGHTGGQVMIAALKSVLAGQGRTDIEIAEQSCLWNCTQSCSVAIRDTERFSYITGRHEPLLTQAEAIIQWFDAHGSSPTGEVPFREWPVAMKGHFIARIPPFKVEDAT